MSWLSDPGPLVRFRKHAGPYWRPPGWHETLAKYRLLEYQADALLAMFDGGYILPAHMVNDRNVRHTYGISARDRILKELGYVTIRIGILKLTAAGWTIAMELANMLWED
jgi:hypothetical protein